MKRERERYGENPHSNTFCKQNSPTQTSVIYDLPGSNQHFTICRHLYDVAARRSGFLQRITFSLSDRQISKFKNFL